MENKVDKSVRRLAIFLHYDGDGIVDNYLDYMFTELRKHVEKIVVVSNSKINKDSRKKLNKLVDKVWFHKNIGFDVWAYKDALARIGDEKLAEYDEIILLNYTFFGPIGSFDDLFAKMDAQEDLGFWGITDHAECVPHPFANRAKMPRHLQSHWIAIRKSLFTSNDFKQYWDEMPMIKSYNDSILHHETKFTEHFAELGYKWDCAFPAENYPTMNPVMDTPDLMVLDGCPIVKRRLFFHDPLYLDRHAVLPAKTLELMEQRGYPMDLVWENLARTTAPRILQANTAGMSVFDAKAPAVSLPSDFRVLVIAHIYYVDMAAELFGTISNIPNKSRVVVTAVDEEKAAEIREIAVEQGVDNCDVRVLESNRGRDVSALLVACGDVLATDDYDVVIKLHSKRSVQDGYSVGTFFKDHLIENLAPTESYATQMLNEMVNDKSIGMVFPPVIHTGYPTMGHGWFGNEHGVKQLFKRMGINAVLDHDTPLAPLGSMYVARREIFQPLLRLKLDWEDFPDNGGYGDASLPHVIERAMGYIPGALGMRVKTVASTERIARDYTVLEYKYQLIANKLPGWPQEQAAYVGALGIMLAPLAGVKRYLFIRHPRLVILLKPIYRLARKIKNS